MKERTQMMIFLVVFLTIFFLMNYFVINNYFNYLEIAKNYFFYILMLFLTVSYPLAMLIEKKISGKTAKYFYIFASIWIGFLFISFFTILIFKLIVLVSGINQIYYGKYLIYFCIIISLYSIINAKRLVIKELNLEVSGLNKDIKIVQLSDIHLGSINRENYLRKIVDKTNSLNPDVVFVTGDLVDGSAPITKHMVDQINKIKAPVYYIIGNHEIYEGLENIMPVLKKTKMNILRDSIKKFKDLTILGIDYKEGNKFVNEKLKEYNFDGKKPVVLLYHAPSIKVDELSRRNITLHLSGHTHSGQIFPFNLLVKLAFPYVYGLHKSKDDKSYAYVSSGAGTWGPPMRLGSNCEIVSITLKPIHN